MFPMCLGVLLLLFLQSVQSTTLHSSAQPLLRDFDALGAWFQGVTNIPGNTSEIALPGKNTSIAIVGAGISGLATALFLDSVGVHNWELIEASDRVGGRFRTKYVGNSSEWADMGPMRLPYNVTYKSDGETLDYTDHRLVFQIADLLNEMNEQNPDLKVDFIPWIQHHPNELLGLGTGRHPDGRIPTRAEIAEDSSLGRPAPLSSEEYKAAKKQMDQILKSEETLRSIQKDVWRAHGKAMQDGLDDWSQQAWLRQVIKASENITDAITTSSDYDVFWDELHHNSNLAQDGGSGALALTEFKCVDGGFKKLSDAFLPHVSSRLMLNRKIHKVESVKSGRNETNVRLSWRKSKIDRTVESKEYDYTILAVPFTMTRFMSLPKFSSVLSRAIGEPGLVHNSACKVGLLFSERFWEKGERPIFGGYSTPPSVAVGALYYPTYGHNESRPGLILHYKAADWANRMVSLSDEEHVEMVLDAIVDLHGEQARKLYTGHYERLCWSEDEHTAVAWARPAIAQHKLYIPAYHQTEHQTILIGESTAPTHSWVSSALYSSIRGTVQLLLELGLVDEAKEVNQRWMGQWIE